MNTLQIPSLPFQQLTEDRFELIGSDCNAGNITDWIKEEYHD